MRVQILRQLRLGAALEQLFRQRLVGRWNFLRVVVANDSNQLDDIAIAIVSSILGVLVFVEVECHAQLGFLDLFVS